MKKRKKHVLILGGSSDIGIELSKYFLKKNWNVTAHVNSNLKQIKKINNKNFKYINLDFSTINNGKILKNIFSDEFDSLVNLVGYTDNQNFETFEIDEVLKTYKINTLVPMKIISILIKKMIKNKFGRILNCSSIGVKFGGGSSTFSYSISKKALEFIPKSAKSLAKKNILFNVVRLGVVDTKLHSKIKNKSMKKREELIPIGRKAQISEVIKPMYYLSSAENSFVTGEVISIAGGE